MKIKQGSKVTVEYIGRFEDGTVFDKSKQPLVFEVGAKKVIPGFEQKIIGMEKGQTKKITLKPEEAYGKKNEKLIFEVTKEVLKNRGVEPRAGMRVKMEPKDPKHPPRMATITKVTDKTIVLDLNHPLAGKTLIFDLKIIDVQWAL